MSGETIYNKNSQHWSRRKFITSSLKSLAILPLASSALNSCSSSQRIIPGSIVGASAAVGHKLREGKFPEPSDITEIDIVIAGGGVAGLSAARYLHKQGITSFMLLEVDKETGGNCASGKNNYSEYPWGAHYLPVPEPEMTDLIAFLHESGAITGFENNLPVYNEYYLCFDPEERLFIKGHWQEGLIPSFGLPEEEHKEINRFLNLMEEYRQAKGSDGKYAFAIPLDDSSLDNTYRKLDQLSMKDFLKSHQFNSEALHWYLDYCCRDDYGTTIAQTSAWAGIHYFAARRGKGANADYHQVLTWPEGNAWLARKLREPVSNNIQSNSLVYRVSRKEDKIITDYWDVSKNQSRRIISKHIVLALPRFIENRIADESLKREKHIYDAFTYAPWMIANITVDSLEERKGAPLSWDNVFYQANSLGYVNASHQHLSSHSNKKVLTLYLPLTEGDPFNERMKAYHRSHQEWCSMVIEEMKVAHPNIVDKAENIDIWLWGHGMIRPKPGFIWGDKRQQAMKSNANIHYAHSDLSGISIFEEAFYHGIRAAKEILNG